MLIHEALLCVMVLNKNTQNKYPELRLFDKMVGNNWNTSNPAFDLNVKLCESANVIEKCAQISACSLNPW